MEFDGEFRLSVSFLGIRIRILPVRKKKKYKLGNYTPKKIQKRALAAEKKAQKQLLKEKEKAEKLGVKAYRLSFTIETQQETEKIVRAFVDVYLRGQKPDGQMQTEETTKGHFQRGVE